MSGNVSDLAPVTDEDAELVADEDATNECGVCGGTIVRIGSARYFKWRGKLRISEVWSCSECRTSGNRLLSREDGRAVRLSPVFTGNGFEILEEDDRLVTDGGRSRSSVSRADPSGTGDGFASFFAQNESGRLRVVCSQCKRTWYPTPISGISRTAGSPYCPDCGTDFRVWVAYQQIFGGDFADAE